jgi:hypothetical protein
MLVLLATKRQGTKSRPQFMAAFVAAQAREALENRG